MIRLTFLLLLVGFGVSAQVVNDSISNRVELNLDSGWFSSSTNHATVEWSCINKALTSKCVVYHNDQWFFFKPKRNGRYYINVASGQCRDKRGVQAIVIEGNPCEVSTYRVLHCISQIREDDAFIVLDSLKAGVSYLINIDGFLGDFCEFKIQFSTSPIGVPISPSYREGLKLIASTTDSLIILNWQAPDSLVNSLSYFNIYRKHELEKSSRMLGRITLERNALGVSEKFYEHSDTLSRIGKYEYIIYGVSNDGDIYVLGRKTVPFNRDSKPLSPHRIKFPFHSKSNAVVQVNIFNSATETLLSFTTRTITKGQNNIMVDLTKYVNDGVRFYKVVISGKNIREERYFTVRR